MLGIGADMPPPPPPGPEAMRAGAASKAIKAIAVAARFMDVLLCPVIMDPSRVSNLSGFFQSGPGFVAYFVVSSTGGCDEIHAHVHVETRYQDARRGDLP